ncbi:MAG: hypothetical protein V3V92_02360 [Candidatus Hydrothermarchaeales archaeon]
MRLKTIVVFSKEERGQGAIEYILLAGGIIVAAVVIFALYSKMTRQAALAMNQSVQQAVGTYNASIQNEIASSM